MNIEPTYITFEQAKLLKEKGFDLQTISAYHNGLTNNEGKSIAGVPCSADNPKKDYPKYNLIARPEQWMVIEWLRVNHGIHITYNCDWNWKQKQYRHRAKFYYIIDFDLLDSMDEKLNPKFLFNSPQEAYLAAIDHVLTSLI